MSAPERTFIIGGTHREALGWCRENGVAPYARTTIIATHGDAIRGHAIRPEDRVVWHVTHVPTELLEQVRVAQMVGGSR